MNQYWTPLARVLGLYGDKEPAPAGGDAGAAAKAPADGLSTHWPELFEAFRQHALDEWLPACKRHAEINAQDVLALQALTITPCDPQIAAQLALWQQEGDASALIRWLVGGPWNLPEVVRCMDFSGFEGLTIQAPETAPAPESASRFDWRQQPQTPRAQKRLWVLEARTAWIERAEEPPTPTPPPAPPPEAPQAESDWQLVVSDANAIRHWRLPNGLCLVGQEKTVRMPDGTRQALKDQMPLVWEGQDARYAAVHGTLVSGLHLAIRTGADGVECQDLDSTNGTYLADRKLESHRWTAWPANVQLHVGGPARDLRSQAPSLEVSRARAGQPISLEATPLRQGTETPLLSLQPTAGGDPIAVTRLPFLIGRDPRCDWVIAPEHAMVSRQHFVIEAVDRTAHRIRVRDLSSQGLTGCADTPSSALKTGAWVGAGVTVVLGASDPNPGVSFELRWAA